MTFKLDPIRRAAAFILLFAGCALAAHFSNQVFLHLVATLGFGLALYVAYTEFSTKRKNVWDTVITSLIIFLLVHYGSTMTDLLYPLLITFIAITMKFFVEFKSSPVVNPAAGAVLLAALLLAFIPGTSLPFVSWWGASFGGYLSLGLMALWIVGGLYQWRKSAIVGSFLLAHAVLLLLRGQGMEGLQFAFTDATIYFFAAFMLVDPKTSPFKPRDQILYGLVAAGLYNLLAWLGTPYFELFALVGANLFRMGTMMLPKKNGPKV